MDKAGVYKVLLGTAAVSGVALASGFTVAAPAALLPLLGGIASRTVDNIGLQFFSSTAEGLAERLAKARGRGAELFRNEHLQALFTETLAAKLRALSDDESLEKAIRRRLPALVAKVYVCWQAWAEQGPEESPQRRLLSDEGITEFFEMPPAEFRKSRMLDGETWGAFLLHLEETVSRDTVVRKLLDRFTQDLETAFNRRPLDAVASRQVGEILAATLPQSLFNAAKDSFESNKPAYAGLQLHLMRDLMTDVRALAAQGAATDEAVLALAGEFRERSSQLERGLDAGLRARFGHLHEEILRQHEEVVGLLKTLVAAQVSQLSEALERGWEVADRRPFPFQYLVPATPVVGGQARRLLEHDFPAFLDDPRPACWWMWTGLEGSGKSRLAMEACRRSGGWSAGFMSPERRGGWAERWRSVVADGDTILVFDDISMDPAEVRRALGELVDRFRYHPESLRGHRVRIVLLERHVEALSPGDSRPYWFARLFPVGRDGLDPRSRILMEAQYPVAGAPSEHIEGMRHPEAAELAMAYLEQLDPPAAMAEAVCRQALELLGPAPRPLHVLLAVHVLSRRTHPGEAPPEDFRGVMTNWLAGRIRQRRDLLAGARADDLTARRVLNLVCLATVIGTIRLAEVPAHPELPDREALSRPELLEAVGQDPRSGSVRGLEPHLIGEWFVFLWAGTDQLGPSMTAEHLLEILEQLPDSTRQIEAFVQRTYRTFHQDDLWRTLCDRLGRYATPFGRLFDASARQIALLGGTTEAAMRTYREAILDRIRSTIAEQGEAVVVDLMAGGSDLPRSLVEQFGDRITLIAIDRDLSRIPRGEQDDPLKLERAEVDGRLPLADIVRRHNLGVPQCDLVIAKKALHELTRESQMQLIGSIGQVVRPGGAIVVYADSPVCIDRRRLRVWERLETRLKSVLDVSTGRNDIDGARRWLLSDEVAFSPEDPCDAAVFANLWIRLKDWANYNRHEWNHRYFSSRNELEQAFAQAGFSTQAAEGAQVHEYAMALHAPRFQEEAINRLTYLCQDPDFKPEDLASILQDNRRYRLFWDFSRHHLWQDGGPTRFGRADHVGAKIEAPFRVSDLLAHDPDVLGKCQSLPQVTEPSFQMPVHVFSLPKLA